MWLWSAARDALPLAGVLIQHQATLGVSRHRLLRVASRSEDMQGALSACAGARE